MKYEITDEKQFFKTFLEDHSFRDDVINILMNYMNQSQSDELKCSIACHFHQEIDIVADILKIGKFSFQILKD